MRVAERAPGADLINTMASHGLRGAMASLLSEAGHSDSSVSMKTGYRDVNRLQNYQNLFGKNISSMVIHLKRMKIVCWRKHPRVYYIRAGDEARRKCGKGSVAYDSSLGNIRGQNISISVVHNQFN